MSGDQECDEDVQIEFVKAKTNDEGNFYSLDLEFQNTGRDLENIIILFKTNGKLPNGACREIRKVWSKGEYLHQHFGDSELSPDWTKLELTIYKNWEDYRKEEHIETFRFSRP